MSPTFAAGEAASLTRMCDDLVNAAVKRPYGWGWPGEGTAPLGGVSIDPETTAAAGFVLYWAGDALDNPNYKAAAIEAAHGLITAQTPSGAIPPRVVFFRSNTGGFQNQVLLADRRQTCAALGLFLSVVDDAGDSDSRIHGGAMRARGWLLHQQPWNGTWPQADPPTTQPKDAVRLIRLDNGDWRNCTFAMLLSAEVLNDVAARLSVEKSNDFLMRIRIGGVSPVGGPLWATAYGMDTFPTGRLKDFPPGVDVVGSRMAMQTLLGTALLVDDPTTQPVDQGGKLTAIQAFADAANAMEKLPRYDGQLMRRYDYDVDANKAPLPPLDSAFTTVPQVIVTSRQTGDFGVRAVLRAADVLKRTSRRVLIAKLSEEMNLRERLSAAIVGVEEEPFSVKVESTESPRAGGELSLPERVRVAWRMLRELREATAAGTR